ncbi:MAG: YggS family pyridoxal phosphate-dependent enzyme [Gammaproteobacteria bacterium]|nr:YggS family pyridoxal phosphate-dependent enzyme [Gammaproteobacteria bacterium]NNC97888.1 YggS family pyridoxal phosphate-dependent enzyme [Gammaproteobacteria bacterium]NNM13543.1 YggS family pyridoxal phosphate-dependent enzyme [Gammaproteobacteria bacterium]
MTDIPNNLYQIRDEIQRYAKACGQDTEQIRLIAVSKTHNVESILAAASAGQRDFAENYVQEGLEKIQKIRALDGQIADQLCWHYIGQIQGNKCQAIATHFDWVHSLCSIKHAQRLNRLRPEACQPLQICVQVQLENKPGRGGITLADVPEFLSEICDLPQINVRGLMCVLPEGMRGDAAYAGFSRVRDVLLEQGKAHPSLDTLSMGMSGDFREAIRAGSNMLRLGSAIFGARG